MDLYCVKCGEPWDNDSIHEEVAARGDNSTYYTVLAEFQSQGCVAFREAFGVPECTPPNATAAQRGAVMSAMFDLLGDDADGAAAMMEDFGF